MERRWQQAMGTKASPSGMSPLKQHRVHHSVQREYKVLPSVPMADCLQQEARIKQFGCGTSRRGFLQMCLSLLTDIKGTSRVLPLALMGKCLHQAMSREQRSYGIWNREVLSTRRSAIPAKCLVRYSAPMGR